MPKMPQFNVFNVKIGSSDDVLHSLVSLVEDVLFAASLETGELLYLNQAAEKIYGRTVKDFHSDTKLWFDVIHPDDKAIVAKSMEQASQDGNGVYECRIVRPDGAIRWLSTQWRCIKDEETGKARIEGICKDCTSLKESEEALKTSESNLKFILESARAHAWDWDLQKQAFIRSDGHKWLYGYDTDFIDASLNRHLNIIHSEDQELVRKNVQKALEHGGEHRLVYRIVTADQNIRWISTTAMVQKDKNGVATRVSGISSDITHIKNVELTLLEYQSKLMIALQSGNIGILEWDPDSGVIVWSDTLMHMHEWSSESQTLTATDFFNIIVPEDIPAVQSRIESLLSNKTQTIQYEYRIPLKDGSIRWMYATMRLMRNVGSKKRLLVGAATDVTERKQASSLLAAKEAAEKANAAKSLFLANISHELRTPMHGILSFAHFGLQKWNSAPKEKLQSYFKEIRDSGDRLMSLVDDLLDLAKLEAGKVTYKPAPVNLVEITKNVISEMRAFAHQRKVRLELTGYSTPKIGYVDGSRISQVIRNFTSNAIKFSYPNTKIILAITEDAHTLTLTVTNKGLGIPKDELETIFDKFIQSSKTRTGSGGTGLGLSISKEIIFHHNGKIWAESDPDGTTRFTFNIPKNEELHKDVA